MRRKMILAMTMMGCVACGDGNNGQDAETLCPQVQVLCGDRCVDPQTDRSYCGASGDCTGTSAGALCGPGEICAGGLCATSCLADQVLCGDRCVDPQTDRSYCGASGDCTGTSAGALCGPGEICAGGLCEASCVLGQIACAETCVDPQTNRNYCGASGDCTAGNAGAACDADDICVDGVCVATCPAGELLCGGRCVDPLTDHGFCGASNNCAGENAGSACGPPEICQAGVCILCPDGHGICDSACTHLQSDDSNCGACRISCEADTSCVRSACRTCTTGLQLGGGLSHEVGDQPRAALASDLNGDGHPDLISVNSGSNTVSVLMSVGPGSYLPQVTYAVGAEPSSATLADFDGDGVLDLAVTNLGDDTVSVLLGMGDGSFASPLTYAVGAGPASVAAADFDGDGNPDLATTNSRDGTVSVLMGLGSGAFAPSATYPVGRTPRSIAAGDLNHDATVDLVVANASENTVSVLLGVGDGTFEAQATYPVGMLPTAVVIATLCCDSHPDLITTNALDNTVSVLSGVGDGTFSGQATYAVGAYPISVTAASGDLMVANFADDTVSVLRQDGQAFRPQETYPAGAQPTSVTAADLGGDSRPDLLVANAGDNTVRVLWQGAEATFGLHLQVDLCPSLHQLKGVATADIDNDGNLDIIASCGDGLFGEGTVKVILGRGDGTFHSPRSFGVGRVPSAPQARDLDGDGFADIVVANGEDDTISVLINAGDGTYRSQVTYAVGEYPLSVAIGNLVYGDRPAIVTANYSDNTVSVLLNNGDGTFAEQVQHHVYIADASGIPVCFGPASLALGNADHSMPASHDVVVGLDGGGVSLLSNHNWLGNLGPLYTRILGPGVVAIALARIQGHSNSSLITANDGSTRVSVFEFYGAIGSLEVGGIPVSVAARDVNGDGFLDILTTIRRAPGESNAVSVLLNDGTHLIGFSSPITYDAPGAENLAIGDFNNDGRPDILAHRHILMGYLFLNEGNQTCD